MQNKINNPLEGIMTRNTEDPRKNPEGYMDLTPYHAMNNEFPKRGGVYCIDDKQALVVSYDENNFHANSVSFVWVFPMCRADPLPTHVHIGEKSVRCERITSYPRSRFGKMVEKLSNEDMKRVEDALLISLGISAKPAEAPAPERNTGSEMVVLETERNMYKRLYEQLLARITRDKV